MSEVEAQPVASEPAVGGSTFAAHLARIQESEPVTAPETPVADASPAPPAPDPATFRVPNDQSIPEQFRKFANKPLSEVFESVSNAERRMHEATAEAAKLRRDMEDFRIRQIATEQLRTPAAPPAPVDPWAATGLDPAEAVITNTRGFADATVSIAEQRARIAAQEESAKAIKAWRDEQTKASQQQAMAGKLIGTFEAAKAAIRAAGYDLSDDQWRTDLDFIAPHVMRDNEQRDGAINDVNSYVTHFQRLRGAPTAAPRATLPTEGNPPVSGRAAVVNPSTPSAPTVSRETRQLYEQIYGSFRTMDPAKRDELMKSAMTKGETR